MVLRVMKNAVNMVFEEKKRNSLLEIRNPKLNVIESQLETRSSKLLKNILIHGFLPEKHENQNLGTTPRQGHKPGREGCAQLKFY